MSPWAPGRAWERAARAVLRHLRAGAQAPRTRRRRQRRTPAAAEEAARPMYCACATTYCTWADVPELGAGAPDLLRGGYSALSADLFTRSWSERDCMRPIFRRL